MCSSDLGLLFVKQQVSFICSFTLTGVFSLEKAVRLICVTLLVGKSYAVSAIVLTDDHLKIIVDMSWLIGRTGNEAVTMKHEQPLKRVRQVVSVRLEEFVTD